MAPLIYLGAKAGATDRSFTGAAGIFPADQLQYFALIRSSGEHLLAANGFDLGEGGHVLLNPMFAVSGLIWRAGVSVEFSFLLWLPVAVLVVFIGSRTFVRRFLGPGRAASCALALALFAVSPVVAVASWAGAPGEKALDLVAGESATAPLLWGYLPAAVALGLVPLCVLGLARLISEDRRPQPRVLAATSATGALAAWLHPWQGVLLLLLAGGLLLWTRRRSAVFATAVPIAAIGLPLLYLFGLSHGDPSFELARAQLPTLRPNFLAIAIALAPLGVLAGFGVRRPLEEPHERLLVMWPPVSVAASLLLPLDVLSHLLEGISVPLAVLAVRGWQRLPLPAKAVVPALAVAIVPGLIYSADQTRQAADADRLGFFLDSGETSALAALDRAPGDGGVLSDAAVGAAVPAFTGRRTWVGHPTWTPDYPHRSRETGALFSGRISPHRARRLVRRAGARWLLVPCGRPDVAPLLGPLVVRRQAFGCARVYEIAVPVRPGLVTAPERDRSSAAASHATAVTQDSHNAIIRTE